MRKLQFQLYHHRLGGRVAKRRSAAGAFSGFDELQRATGTMQLGLAHEAWKDNGHRMVPVS
jgi:hypothetical protein